MATGKIGSVVPPPTLYTAVGGSMNSSNQLGQISSLPSPMRDLRLETLDEPVSVTIVRSC